MSPSYLTVTVLKYFHMKKEKSNAYENRNREALIQPSFLQLCIEWVYSNMRGVTIK
jgi:hypothetical protein